MKMRKELDNAKGSGDAYIFQPTIQHARDVAKPVQDCITRYGSYRGNPA